MSETSILALATSAPVNDCPLLAGQARALANPQTGREENTHDAGQGEDREDARQGVPARPKV